MHVVFNRQDRISTSIRCESVIYIMKAHKPFVRPRFVAVFQVLPS